MTGSAETIGDLRLSRSNPFVGPRPLERGEKLYGRDREIRELDRLLSGERIVLLHSPSGAGKSSLVQAGLLPQQFSFDVWGPTRVNQEAPVDGANRYVMSTVLGLEEGIPERLRRPPRALAAQTLRGYVDERPHRRSAPDNVLLVFDQFEEVLTVDPLALEAKREFFDQLGELLRNPRVWALFVLREDYLAALDPYARQVPSQLRNRFRIDLLGLDGARQAMVETAREGGREFPAAERLVRDLAARKLQQGDGSFVEQTGHHVEPVQLQVVCFRLWQAMPAEALSIDAEDLGRFGDVTEALGAYYADSVAGLAGGDAARERAIREWFGERLIAAGGIRGQVLKGAEESEGLANEVVERLRDAHLVRAEQRAGATWYELAHDRLIEPVRDSNATWRAEHLSEVQERAALWEREGRPAGLLLAGEELAAAERWAATAAAITDTEDRFLDESKKARAVAERERRQTRRIRRLGVAATVVAALALGAGGVAVSQMSEANRQREEAEHQRQVAEDKSAEAERERRRATEQAEIAEQKRQEAEDERQRAEDERRRAEEQEGIAVFQKKVAEDKEREAQSEKSRAEDERRRAEDERRRAETQEAIAVEQKEVADSERAKAEAAEEEAQRLRRLAEAEALAVGTTSMTEDALHELAALLALQAYRLHRSSGGEPDSPELYNALHLALQQLGSARTRVLLGHQADVRGLAVSPDGRTLASGAEDGEVRLRDLGRPGAEATSVGRLDDAVRALAWSLDGKHLAAGSFRGTVQVWDAERRTAAPRFLADDGAAVNALAFHLPGGLAAGDAGGGVRLWDLDAGGGEPDVLVPGASGQDVRDLAWSGDGAALAVASYGRGVLIWDGETRLLAAEPEVRSVAWSPDSRLLAAGTARGAVVVWEPSRPGAEPLRLLGHKSRVEALEFHPRRELLASGSLDRSLRLWDLRRDDVAPLVLEGHQSWIWAATFSPDGERLISGGGDGAIHLWATSSEALAAEICQQVTRNLTRAEWDEHLPAGVDYELTCPELRGENR